MRLPYHLHPEWRRRSRKSMGAIHLETTHLSMASTAPADSYHKKRFEARRGLSVV